MQEFLIKEYEINTGKIAYDVPDATYNGRQYSEHFVDWLADRELNVSVIAKMNIIKGDVIFCKMPEGASEYDYQETVKTVGPAFPDNEVFAVPDIIRLEKLNEHLLAKIGLMKKRIIT